MTLNQLSLEMSERLGFKEIDASVISRVLTGERVLTQQQLCVFCKILKLKKSEETNLKLSLHSEIYSKFQGRFLLNIDLDQFPEMAESAMLMVREANEKCASKLAFQWATDIEERVKQELCKISDSKAINRLQQIQFGLLEQQSISILRTEMPEKAISEVWPILIRMMNIAKQLKIRNEIGFTYAKMAEVLSLVGDRTGNKEMLSKSSPLFKKSLSFVEPQEKIYPLSYWMLNESYLKNIKNFEMLKKEVYKLIPSVSYSEACETCNILAKSKITIGETSNLENDFVKGWKYFKIIPEIGKSSVIFRKVQLTRTEVQAATQGYEFRNPDKLKGLIIEGLFASKEFGYKRYFDTTMEMLAKSKEKLKVDFFDDNF